MRVLAIGVLASAFVAVASPTATLGGSAGAEEVDALPGAQVVVVNAANACFSAAIFVTGYLVPRKEAIVTLSPGERVIEVIAAEGDRVTAGQTLVQVSRPSREPPRPGVEPKSETAGLKAPAAGTIVRSTASVGATMSPIPTEPMFRIAVDNEVELEAEVPSIHVPELSPGQFARVQFRDAGEVSGRVRLVPAAIDQQTQLGRARISLDRDARLQFDMFARATISANRSCGISVPRSAVTYRTGGTTVQVVHNNVIETRSVQVGLHSDLDAEIRKGLGQGELVVANAGSSLRDGDRVRPIDAGAVRPGPR